MKIIDYVVDLSNSLGYSNETTKTICSIINIVKKEIERIKCKIGEYDNEC